MTRRFLLTLLCLIVILVLGSTRSTSAADCYVNGTTGDDSYDGLAPAWDGVHGPKATIQGGIDAASDTDTVTVADGTYTGAGNRDLDFGGKAITVRSENGADTCIIDCEGSLRGFRFLSGEDADSVVDGFTICNATYFGIHCDDSSPTITNCTITDNSGGVYCSGASPTIAHCTITDNSGWNGGLLCSGSATVTNCTITGNSAIYSSGGLSCSGSATIANCTIVGNSAGERGGGIGCSGSPTITNCTIVGNSAGERGGGISCSGSPTITNCTIVGNSAGERGGGIFFVESHLASVTNTIVWGNRAGLGPQICLWGDYFSDPYTVLVRWSNVEGGRAGAFEGAKSTLDYDASNIDVDPLLTPAGYLRAGSPCIDWCPDGPADDINGEARPFGSGYDIGADEFVDTDGDGLPDWWEAAYYADAGGDPDGDGLDNLGEYEHSGDPANADTDGDGWSDGDEVSIYGTDPSHVDTDRDGLSDTDEVMLYGTDPDDADTDDDGWTDGEEVAAATDPLSPDTTIYVNGTTGDDAWDGFAPSYDGTHGPKRTIRAGFDTARSNAGHVVLVADGTYTGDGNTGLWYNGKAVTVRSENGPESCIIDLGGEPGFDFFYGEGADSVLEGFTISHANSYIIRCRWSSPTITNCIMTGKSSYKRGGGIECRQASPTVTNCTIADTYGGIFSHEDSSPTITDCTITGNSTTYVGGGIFCSGGSPVITNCTITGNTVSGSGRGGGICCGNSSPTITNCTVAGNSHGGIYCLNSTVTIANCTVSGNSIGGILCAGGDATITNCTVTGNYSEEYPGGIYCWGGSATITNCTITGNTAERASGIWAEHASVTIRNCILWGNTALALEGPQLWLSDSILTLRYCDVQGGAAEAYLEEGSTLDYDASNIEADPLLRPDWHLVSGSPCVDWCPDGPANDMDGEARPFGSGYDIGADEFVDTDGDRLPDWWELAWFGSPTAARAWGDPDHDWARNIAEYEWATDPFDPDTDDDGRRDGRELRHGTNPLHPDSREKTYYVNGSTGDDAWDGLASSYDGVHGPKRTIQAGIDATITGWGYTVLVAEGTYAGEGNRDLHFNGKAITVKSAKGADVTIIDCQGTESDGHGGFVLHSWELADSVIDGFTIQNGYGEAGFGIDCYKSSPTITNCVIVDNSRYGIYCIYNSSPTIANCTVTGNAGGIRCAGHNATIVNCTVASNSGGGIRSSGGSPTIANCTITNNSGGGIECSGQNATITNCTITGNSGGWAGGGIDCTGDSSTITNCTIAGNSASYYGGGICCWGDNVMITNCTITGNSATAYGGGIYTRYGGGTITNCILWDNTAPDGHEIGMRGTAVVAVLYCDVQGGAAEVYLEEGCTLDYDASNVDADPLFRDPPNGDYRLQWWSPCIDAGTSDGAPERDILGARRWDVPWVPNTGGGDMPWYDIGAYEFFPGRRWGHFHPHWHR